MSSFFTYAERISLQKFLAEGLSFKEISRRLDKHPTTISREVRSKLSQVTTGRPGYSYNPCKNRKTCKRKDVCGRSCIHQSYYKCSLCIECHSHCDDFVEEICINRLKVPYVCNGCSMIGKCTLMKNIYDAEHAQYKAHEVISSSRSGLCTSEDEMPGCRSILEIRNSAERETA